jgi:hypothetical protein
LIQAVLLLNNRDFCVCLITEISASGKVIKDLPNNGAVKVVGLLCWKGMSNDKNILFGFPSMFNIYSRSDIIVDQKTWKKVGSRDPEEHLL